MPVSRLIRIMRILIIGQSKSGKSAFAQEKAVSLSAGAPRYYWAAMEPRDEEDRIRIERHRRDREGLGFRTVEEGRELLRCLSRIEKNGTVLFDSLTAYLSNTLFSEEIFGTGVGTGDLLPEPQETVRRMEEKAEDCLLALRTVSLHPSRFLLVADDIFRDGCRYDELTESYRRLMAHMLRTLAAEFDEVYECAAGIPLRLK